MSTYSPSLRLELITTGDQAGTWGNTTNNNLGTLLETGVTGYTSVSVTSANQAFTALNGVPDQARNMVIALTTTTTAPFNVYAPPVEKVYIIYNASSYSATVYNSTVIGNTTAAGTGITIPSGKITMIWTDGTNFYSAFNYAPGAFAISGAQTLEASQTINGSQTVRGSIGANGTFTTTSSAYLNGVSAQTVAQATEISTANETITLATAAFSNDLAVVLTSSGTMPTGLSTNTTYYVVGTSATAYFSGAGSISGVTLTISSVYAGSIGIGTTITGPGIAATTVTALGTGTGGAGTYTVGTSQTVSSTTINGTYSGTQTIKLSTSIGGSAVNITNVGSGNLTLTPVSIGITAPAGTTTNALATCAFVANSLPVSLTNWTITETQATQTATITIATPAVVTVAASPANGTAVSFSTTGALPTGITANAAYYVYGRTSTTYKIATTPDVSQTATITIASPGVVTVTSAPSDGDVVTFTTTGALPTGLTAGTDYYVVNRTSTTFQVSASSGGTAITTTGTQSGTQTATWRTLVNTSGSQSGTHTETTSQLQFNYKSQSKTTIDLGGRLDSTLDANDLASGTVPTARLGSGFPSSSTYLRGDQTWSALPAGLSGSSGQVFTSSGTFTIPADITAVKVTVIGGGGGGSGSISIGCGNFNSGVGGGGGGTAISFLTSLTPGNTLAVTIGAAGSAGAGSASGGAGGNSTVASGTQTISTITGSGGGGGGAVQTYSGGTGGGSSGGTINITGGGGSVGGLASGIGGSSTLGGGANGRMNGGNGFTGGAYGGGGSGGPGDASRSGGAGSAGVVIFEW